MSLLGTVANALGILSTGLDIFNAVNSGNQQEDVFDAQAARTDQEARNRIIDALAAADVAFVSAGKTRRAGTEVRSAARAAYSAAGVDVNTGTPLDVQADITRRAEEDALNQILLGERQRTRLEADAAALSAESASLREAGDNARTSGYLGAAGSLLRGGARTFSNWQ